MLVHIQSHLLCFCLCSHAKPVLQRRPLCNSKFTLLVSQRSILFSPLYKQGNWGLGDMNKLQESQLCGTKLFPTPCCFIIVQTIHEHAKQSFADQINILTFKQIHFKIIVEEKICSWNLARKEAKLLAYFLKSKSTLIPYNSVMW